MIIGKVVKIWRAFCDAVKRVMPTRGARDDDGTILVLELVGCDVNDQFAPPKPRMTTRGALAKAVVKGAAFLVTQICRQQARSVSTRASGKLAQGQRRTTGLRIILHNCLDASPEFGGKCYQVTYLKVHEAIGDVLVSADYPVDFVRSGMPKP